MERIMEVDILMPTQGAASKLAACDIFKYLLERRK